MSPQPPQVQAPSKVTIAGRSPRAIVVFIVVAVLTLAADLGLKSWAFRHVAGVPVELDPERAFDPTQIPLHEGVMVVPGMLKLKLTANIGAVFGMGKGGQKFFVAFSVVAAVGIAWFFSTTPADARAAHLALAMILAGALGNMYDRVAYRAVRDMLLLFPGVRLPFGLSWGGGQRDVYPWIFNLADVALVVGVCILGVWLWRQEARFRAQEAAKAPH